MQGPRLYRFFNYEQVQYLQAPTGGWAPDVNAWELASNQAQILDNFVLRPGKVSVRGGMQSKAILAQFGNNIAPVCTIMGDIPNSSEPWVLVANKAISATAYIDHWNAPLFKPSASTSLAKGDVAHAGTHPPAWVVMNTNPNVTTPGADLTSVPGPRYINFNGLLYGITYDAQGNGNATATDANSNYTIWKTCLYTLPLTQSSFTQPTLQTAAPQGAFDLKGYQARIWMLGGVDTPAGLTAHEPATLYFSRPLGDTGSPALGSPLGNLATDWKDPVAGTTNKLTMDANNDDYGVGLATVRNAMIIFRRHSVWILRGTTTANYTLQLLTNEVGCIDARSILEVDGGVYWISHRGLMFTNGTAVTVTESPASTALRSACEYVVANGGGQGNSPQASTVLMSDGSICVAISLQINQTTSWQYITLWSALYWPGKMGAWSRLMSFGFVNGNSFFSQQGAGQVFGRRANYQSYAVDSQGIMMMEDLASLVSIVTPELFGTSMYDKVTATSSSYIPAQWGSKLLEVVTASKRRYGQIKRFFVDYMTYAFSAIDNNTWTVTLYDASQNQLDTFTANVFASQGTPGLGASSSQQITPNQPIIERVDKYSGVEVDDCWFMVQFVGHLNTGVVTTEIGLWELYGVGAEIQGARELNTRT